jgi:hypothetical protein
MTGSRGLPKLGYCQRRMEWAAIGLEGDEALAAMQREASRFDTPAQEAERILAEENE